MAACLALVAAVTGLAGAQTAGGVPVLVLSGQGWGHGVGMAQDGAFAMASDGAKANAILGHFYAGTAMTRAASVVRVVVLVDGDRDTIVQLPQGGEVRSNREGAQAEGFPLRVGPGGSVRVRYDGGYKASVVSGGAAPTPARAALPARSEGVPAQLPTITTSTTQPAGATSTTTTTTNPPASSTTSTTAPAPPSPLQVTTSTTAPPATAPPAPPGAGPTTTTTPPPPPAVESSSAQTLWVVPPADGTTGVPDRGARYRGVVHVQDGDKGLRLVNEVDVEQYLRGMGEMPASWPRAALEAQAVASRTYAIRAMRASGELCDDQRCQVYLGQQAERPTSDAAVRATAGQVLTYGSALASTVFSANAAGTSATPLEGFGTPDGSHPYLRAVPYPTRTPDTWETSVALADLAPRLGYPGRLTSVTVAATGPSGRPLTLALDGSAGPRSAPALSLSHSLALRSTMWTARLGTSESAPVPPAPAELVQILPDDAAAAAAAHVPEATTVADSGPARVAAPPRSSGRPDPTVPVSFGVAALIVLAGLEWIRRGRTEADT